MNNGKPPRLARVPALGSGPPVWRALWTGAAAILCGAAGLGLSGCVSVNAPGKAIVIELNINIKQEVIYRLAADANKTIDSNKEIF